MDPSVTQREETYQVVLDIIKNTPCYKAFLISADVLEIYMQQFWLTIKKVKKPSFYQFDIDNKTSQIDVEIFREILNICLKVPNQVFNVPSSSSVDDDEVLDRLKFINKGDIYQVYGKPIPDTWITYEIKKYKAYKMYFKYSTGLIPLKKGRGRGAQRTKETDAPKQTNILCKKTTYASKKKQPNRNLLKGIDLLSNATQLEIKTQRAITASRHESRLQHQTDDSSEGAGLRPEVLDELTGKSTDSDEGAGTSPEVLDESKDKSKTRDDLED
nr:hypothetical protein [Tanacetum cinerariifolium]